MSRTIRAAVVAVALTALTAPVAVSAADAAPAAPQRAAKVERQIDVVGKEPKPNRFVMSGRVTPTEGKRAKAVVQRKNCRGSRCSWYGWKKFETGRSGRFDVRVAGPARGQQRVFYRIKVKATDTYTGVTSRVLSIYRL